MINEPTPSPSEEGTAVSPSSSSALRFMESRHSLLSMHWDHEPGRISWSAAVVEDPAAALWMFPACCGWCCAHSRAPMSRFMESCHGHSVAHWNHEPTPNPSQEGN